MLDKTLSVPLYCQLKDALLRQIHDGRFSGNGKMHSEARLASLYGVSRMTARQALKALAQEVPLVRIKGKGTFLAETQSGNRRRKLEYIRFIYPHRRESISPGSFYFRVLAAVEEEARKNDVDVLFSAIDEKRSVVARVQDNEGLLVVGVVDEKLLRLLSVKSSPLCLLDSGTASFAVSRPTGVFSGIVDSYGGGQAAMAHLADMGHRRIALVTTDSVTGAFRERARAYRDGMSAQGQTIEPDWMCTMSWDLRLEDARAILHRILDGAEPATAIFATDHNFALQLVLAAKEEGVRIPEDLSIVAFGDSDRTSYMTPALTSVVIFAEMMGRVGVQQLLTRAEEPDARNAERVFPCHLVIRESVKEKEVVCQ